MASIETARAIYEDESKGEQSVSQLAGKLERRADELESENSIRAQYTAIQSDVRSDIEGVLSGEDAQATADQLDKAASDLRTSLGGYNPTMKDLPGNVAGQAQLASSAMWVDTQAIQSRAGDALIDTEVAADIAAHEARHQEQSASADAEGITVKGQTFDARELREFDAIEAQKSTDFLSAEYKQIRSRAAAVLSGADRELIKQGQFRAVEKRYEDQQALAA